jgi:hypothetical protein
MPFTVSTSGGRGMSWGQPAAPQGAIGGQLPFGGGGGFDYSSAYNSALAMNQANYGNILQGYQQTLAGQQTAQQAIGRGYNQLSADVQNLLSTQGATRQQDIAAQYAKQVGTDTQGLVNRGLGNTTVTSAVGRGLTFDRERAQSANAEAVAGMQAQSMSQLGLAGLSYQDAANRQNTALSGQQLDWMNSVNAQYPDPGTYFQMQRQMAGDRAAQDIADRMGRPSSTTGGGGGLLASRGASGSGGYFQPTSFAGGYTAAAPGGGFFSPAQAAGGAVSGGAAWGADIPYVGGGKDWGGGGTWAPEEYAGGDSFDPRGWADAYQWNPQDLADNFRSSLPGL